MAIDASIYSLLDTKGLQSGLAGIGDAYAQGVEQKNRLSQLSQQSELTGQQIRAGQRAEALVPQQMADAAAARKEKDMRELSSALAFGIQQKNGYSNQGLMDSTYQEAIRRGLKDEDVAKLFEPWASVSNETDGVVVQPTAQEQQGVADIYLKRANPEEAVKKGLNALYPKHLVGDISPELRLAKEIEALPEGEVKDKLIRQEANKGLPNTQFVVSDQGIFKQTKGGQLVDTGLTKTKTGSPAQNLKLEKSMADDFKSTGQVMQTMSEIQNSIKGVLDSGGISAREGYTGYLPAFVQGKDAMTAQNRLDTLKGKVTQMGKAMATMSGAIGPMAVQEWKIVSDAVNAIDPKAGNLTEQLGNIEAQTIGAGNRVRDWYDMKYTDHFADKPQFSPDNIKIYPSNVTPAQNQTRRASDNAPKGGAKFLGFE